LYVGPNRGKFVLPSTARVRWRPSRPEQPGGTASCPVSRCRRKTVLSGALDAPGGAPTSWQPRIREGSPDGGPFPIVRHLSRGPRRDSPCFRPDFRITSPTARRSHGQGRGEVDWRRPELGGVVDGVIDRGLLALVLDLAELEFIDARGSQSSPTVRSTSSFGRHITSGRRRHARPHNGHHRPEAAVRLESEPSSQAIPRQTPNWSGDRVSDPAATSGE